MQILKVNAKLKGCTIYVHFCAKMKGIAHKFLHLTNTTNSGNILIKFVATLYNHCLPKCQLVIVFLWTASSIVVEIEHDFMKMVHT